MRDGSLQYYGNLFRTIEPLPLKRDQIKLEADRMQSGYAEYYRVEKATNVPWTFPAAIHEMECNCNFGCTILNGQSWKRVTTITPAGEGPWTSFFEATVYALNNKRRKDSTWRSLLGWNEWSIEEHLRQWERWNGGGYMKRDRNSAYLWAGCNHGVGTGFYTSDGVYSPTAESQQIGAAVLLWHLINRRRNG